MFYFACSEQQLKDFRQLAKRAGRSDLLRALNLKDSLRDDIQQTWKSLHLANPDFPAISDTAIQVVVEKMLAMEYIPVHGDEPGIVERIERKVCERYHEMLTTFIEEASGQALQTR